MLILLTWGPHFENQLLRKSQEQFERGWEAGEMKEQLRGWIGNLSKGPVITQGSFSVFFKPVICPII